ncbi:long-chain fatty acid--CoA ligase [Kitasatospora cineracea]|uniref:long-chain fatty acid--CoA ligase n=1 Tax=Kitasatospora cineracea TaxID=88074 RepID=UPI00378CC8EC
MLSTMQDIPLAITRIMQHGTTVHGTSEVVTWTGTGARRASYAEVGRRVAQLAHALRELGISGDERVATLMWNNQEHLECYLAVPSMGAVLHTLNLRLPAGRLAWIADQAEDRVVVVDGTLVPLLAAVLPELKTVEHVVVTGPADTAPLERAGKRIHRYEDLLAGRPTGFDWPQDLDERSGAALCHTSGTTGDPKGVLYSHRSTYLHSLQICTAEGFGLGVTSRVLPVVPMFHVNAWGIPYAAMLSGASLVMPDRFLQPEHLARMIATERPTNAAAVPTIWTGLLHHLDEHPADLSSLREVIVGGSACPLPLMKAFQERYGTRILQAWGMTETSPLGSVAREPAGVAGDAAWAYRATQGRLPATVQVRLVGPDGTVLPNDGTTVGEIEIRGPWITGSYYGSDHRADPSGGGRFHDGWLRTGDLGSVSPDGYLRLTDRAKDVIKSGGEWISSVELENHLLGHPAVEDAAVIAVPDPTWGERPLALVVLRPDDSATAPGEEHRLRALRDFLARHVARWQVPEHWAAVPAIPKTSTGKSDKKALRASHADAAVPLRTFR